MAIGHIYEHLVLNYVISKASSEGLLHKFNFFVTGKTYSNLVIVELSASSRANLQFISDKLFEYHYSKDEIDLNKWSLSELSSEEGMQISINEDDVSNLISVSELAWREVGKLDQEVLVERSDQKDIENTYDESCYGITINVENLHATKSLSYQESEFIEFIDRVISYKLKELGFYDSSPYVIDEELPRGWAHEMRLLKTLKDDRHDLKNIQKHLEDELKNLSLDVCFEELRKWTEARLSNENNNLYFDATEHIEQFSAVPAKRILEKSQFEEFCKNISISIFFKTEDFTFNLPTEFYQ